MAPKPRLRAVDGFDGYYVDTYGGVWSCHRRGRAGKFGPVYSPQKLKANWTNKNSRHVSGRYLSVTLTRDESRTKVAMNVHTLVCTAFHGPCPGPEYEVRHLDGDPANNHARNLCWGTRNEQRADQVVHGTSNRGERHGMVKLTTSDVRTIRRQTSSARTAALQFGVTEGHIYRIRNRSIWSWLK